MYNLPKVVAQQRRGWASNLRLLDRKSDALPLSHRGPKVILEEVVEAVAETRLSSNVEGKRIPPACCNNIESMSIQYCHA